MSFHGRSGDSASSLPLYALRHTGSQVDAVSRCPGNTSVDVVLVPRWDGPLLQEDDRWRVCATQLVNQPGLQGCITSEQEHNNDTIHHQLSYYSPDQHFPFSAPELQPSLQCKVLQKQPEVLSAGKMGPVSRKIHSLVSACCWSSWGVGCGWGSIRKAERLSPWDIA